MLGWDVSFTDFYLPQYFSWNDNEHPPLFFSGMNWCNSVGNKNLLKGLHSLSYERNWNGWCYVIVLIWIWLTQGIVTHPAMTLTATKNWNWKARCNFYVNLHLRFFSHDNKSVFCTFLSCTDKLITFPVKWCVFRWLAGCHMVSHDVKTYAILDPPYSESAN